MKPAELTPTAQKIDKLIQRIDDGDIKIPAFQRGYVWKQNQVIELLESVINDYPIGSILLWKSSERIKSTRNLAGYKIPTRDESYPVNYVLDGQQRLASLYGVFSQLTEQENNPLYNPNTDIFELSFDFSKREFIPTNEVTNKDVSIELRKLLDVTQLITALAVLDQKHHKDAQSLASKFLNYELPVVTIENRDRKDVGIIFERINNTGTRLSTIDLMTAWTWTEDFHLLEASNTFFEELEEKHFADIKPVTLLQIISGILVGSTKTEDILNLTGEQVRDNWDSILESIRKAIDFLSTDIRCSHSDFLPFHQQLNPLSKFFYEIISPSSSQLTILRQWFWRTAFSTRYSSGQTNAKMNEDIRNVLEYKTNKFDSIDMYSQEVTVPQLKTVQFSKGNPLTRSFLLLMAQLNPLDLVKNQVIDIGYSLSQFNRKEYHHIFPEAFLRDRGLQKEKIFCVANFCFLSSQSNKKISRRAPSDYFNNIVPQDSFSEILSSNMIPLNKSIYLKDDYEDFLEKRSAIIIQKIDEFCHK